MASNGPQSPPQDLGDARARIDALEQELEDARQNSTSRIQRLESEKADMQNELSALRRKLPDKKPEPVPRTVPVKRGTTPQVMTKPLAKPAANGVQNQEAARLRQELTQLREKHRAEVERLQLQSVCLGFEIMALQDASAGHDADMAALKAEHAAYITTADAHISMLTEQAEYERAESERAGSERETFRKLHEHEEGEGDGNASMDSEQQEGGDTVQILLHHFQHAEDAQPVQVVEAAGSPTEKAVLSTYRTHMKAFRGSGKPPRLCELKPVLDRRRDLRMYLEVDPQLSSYARRALDISARSIQMPRGQYLFFIPTHVWDAGLSAWTTAPREDADPTTSWADALTMGDKQEETKEVFATHGAHRLYVGTFRCHDLSALFPEGVGVPKSISSRAVRDAALSARPPSSNNYDSETLIQRRWPDGMKVHATALEFVGFDSALYDSLRARFVAEEGPIAMFPDEDGTEEGIEKWIEAAEGSKVGNEVEVEKLKEEGQKGEKKEEDEREQEQEHDKEQEQGSTGDEDEAYSGWGLRASRWAV